MRVILVPLRVVRWASVASAVFSVGLFGPAQPRIVLYGPFATLVFMKLQGGQHLGFSCSISDLTRSVVGPCHPSPAPAQDPSSSLRGLTVACECTGLAQAQIALLKCRHAGVCCPR